MSAPPGDRGQLDFLQHVQRIFDEGEFVATYKFALRIALVELAIERGDDTGAPLELDLHSIAEKFIEQYWPHAAPYGAADGAAAVLVQNHGRQAAIVARVAEARGRFGTLARAKSDRGWRGFVGSVAQIVKGMPLWKLQTLRRQSVPEEKKGSESIFRHHLSRSSRREQKIDSDPFFLRRIWSCSCSAARGWTSPRRGARSRTCRRTAASTAAAR